MIGGTTGTVAYGTTGTTAYGVLDILHRDPATGDLTEVGCLSSDGTDGHTGASEACVPTAGLLGGGAVVVSPDGTTVYTGSSSSAAILAFHRDPTTGLLTRFGCLRLTPPLNSRCSPANVFGGIDALAISSDGQGLYAGSGVGGPTPGSTTALSVLTAGLVPASTTTTSATKSAGTTGSTTTTSTTTTSTPSPTTTATATATSATTSSTSTTATTLAPSVASVFGSLAPGQALANPCLATGEVDGACANATSTMNLTSLAISADGRYLYATALSSLAIDIFARDASGNLTQTGCLMATPPPGPCTSFNFLGNPGDIALSPDGKSAYITESTSVIVADRSAANGKLAYGSCVGAATTDNSSSSGSGDSGGGGNGSASRARASATNSDGCTTIDGLSMASAVAVSPDGTSVYVTSSDLGGLVTLARDTATGALSESSCAATADYLSSFSSSSCVKSPGSAGDQLVVSPDGRNVYVLDARSNALYGFGPAAGPASTSAASLRRGALAGLRIACPRAARSVCAGRVRLETGARPARASRRRRGSRARLAARAARAPGGPLVSSSAGFRVAPGRAAAVYVRIPRAMRAALRRERHGLRLVADVLPIPGGGGASARLVVLR